jgi:periplasmic protein TonB
MNYNAPASLSGKQGFTFAGVALLHLLAGYIFYSGLSAKISRLVPPPPLNVSEIQKTAEPIKIPPTPLKFDDAGIDLPPQRDPPIARDERPPPLVAGELPPHSQDSGEVPPIHPTTEKVQTPVRVDPKHPLKIGPEYYPDGSIRNGEQGRCLVQMTVGVNGLVTQASVQASTGYRRLDDACLSAVRGARMLPATVDGRSVESTVSMPIAWTLKGR